MAELLSREKEFIKLNQELDQLAAASLEQSKQQQQPQHQQQHIAISTTTTASNIATERGNNGGGGVGGGGTGGGSGSGGGNISVTSNSTSSKQSPTKHEQRFLTYTKSKGANQTVKKRTGTGIVSNVGAGDGGASEATSDVPATERHIVRTARQSKAPHQSSTSTAPSLRPDGDSTVLAPPETPKTTRNGNITHRKHIKSPDSSTRTYGRNSNSGMRSKESQFTVKYRNPKFVQSPSLEVLIRDESSSLRPRPIADTESVTGSIANGASTSRRSIDPRKHISTDGLIKFLKSKIAILEEDHDRISQEMAQQKELLDKTIERNRKIEQQRDQAFTKHSAVAEQLTKMESQLDEVNRRVKERTLEHSTQQKELEVARRELKLLSQTNTNLEKRLYRANEELENTKNALTMLKTAERELKESMRVEGEAKDKQIKSLKKQRADLLNAYKKQLFLIDNLKRQNICMEQSKMIGFGEKEFTKVLDWNAKI